MSPRRATSAQHGAASIAEIVLRVRVTSPPAGVEFCIQGRISEHLQRVRSRGRELSFETTVRIAEGTRGRPRLLGRSVQGPPEARFLYIGSGTYAGEPSSIWARRAKVPLSGITSKLLSEARKRGTLETTIAGTARDGGPACGTVPLVRSWSVV